jgi:hypothetical protein
MQLLILVRWLHIISGAAWLGEVVTINFVLIPALKSLSAERRIGFIHKVFPRIFRLASLISLISIGSGLWMSYLVSGWDDPSIFFNTRWGLAILIGGSLGFGLTIFHFVVEGRMEPIVAGMDDQTSDADLARVIQFLNLVPRAGLGMMIVIFILMMFAARGI